MDFVENFICMFVEEVQSVYWNLFEVIFYLVVIYYRVEDGILIYDNYVFVLDDLVYNFGILFVILDQLM